MERESLVGEGREGEELLGRWQECPGWGRVGLSKCSDSEEPTRPGARVKGRQAGSLS